MGFYFYPRGGSAHAARAIAGELESNGLDVTLLSGSRSDLGEDALAERFFDGSNLVTADFTPALLSADPTRFSDQLGSTPMHASYEDRLDAPDPVFAALDDAAFEIQVAAWERKLTEAGAGDADLLYLHHLTPMNEAAARAFPGIPIVGHIHGTELLMLERIARGIPAGWRYADEWAQRISEWAAGCDRIVVNSPGGLKRAIALLDLDPERFVLVPNGYHPSFEPYEIDRAALWRRHLVADPRGWVPGSGPGSMSYSEADLPALEGTTLVYSGRFTEVKRLPLLIEAFAAARDRFASPAALVLLGGFPGEWEGEHPIETIRRLGVEDVFLAGWHGHLTLPRFLAAADVMVHASVNEQFGQVLVEGMACEVPPIAVNRGGPATIVDDGVTGWLVPPDDREAMSAAMVEAVNHPEIRRRRGRRARGVAESNYTWERIGGQLERMLSKVVEAADDPSADENLSSASSR